jgi:anti-sigma regulatory factor (Ser/Thr protein kinase)
VVVVEEVSQVGQARREALALADHAGFDEMDAGRVALAATELATNVIKHGRGGRMYLSLVCGRSGRGRRSARFEYLSGSRARGGW